MGLGLLVLFPTVALADPPRAGHDGGVAAATAPQKDGDDPPLASAWWLRKDLADGALDPMWSDGLDGAIAGMRVSGLEASAAPPAAGIAARPIETVGQKIVQAEADGFSAARAQSVYGRATQVLAARDAAGEAIQRIVRANFGRFRLCYEVGLRLNPRLEGRVVAKLTIDTEGAVVVAADGGSDLPDPDVVSCVVRSFANLAFPPTAASGAEAVTVVYPLVFTAGAVGEDPAPGD
jgi:hypothetical protein